MLVSVSSTLFHFTHHARDLLPSLTIGESMCMVHTCAHGPPPPQPDFRVYIQPATPPNLTMTYKKESG